MSDLLIGAPGTGVFSNYYPRKRHRTGVRVSPYTITKDGPVYANGQTYAGDGDTNGDALFEDAKVIDTPNCRNCELAGA